MKLKIFLQPSDEGRCTVYVPILPGCISEGDTKEEAMANIKEAIELWIDTAKKYGDPIPKPKGRLMYA